MRALAELQRLPERERVAMIAASAVVSADTVVGADVGGVKMEPSWEALLRLESSRQQQRAQLPRSASAKGAYPRGAQSSLPSIPAKG